jgi:hypothetical protein
MGHTDSMAGEEYATENRRACQQPRCPMCGGVMFPLGEHYRCSRCFFDLCVGCEGFEVSAPCVVDD